MGKPVLKLGKILLATSRICAMPVTFYNNFDKYNGREGPRDDIVFSNVLQSPTKSIGNSSHFFRTFGLETSVIGQQNLIVHCLREISRRSEVLERIYGGFPSVDPLGVWVEFPYLVKGYICCKVHLSITS